MDKFNPKTGTTYIQIFKTPANFYKLFNYFFVSQNDFINPINPTQLLYFYIMKSKLLTGTQTAFCRWL